MAFQVKHPYMPCTLCLLLQILNFYHPSSTINPTLQSDTLYLGVFKLFVIVAIPENHVFWSLIKFTSFFVQWKLKWLLLPPFSSTLEFDCLDWSMFRSVCCLVKTHMLASTSHTHTHSDQRHGLMHIHPRWVCRCHGRSHSWMINDHCTTSMTFHTSKNQIKTNHHSNFPFYLLPLHDKTLNDKVSQIAHNRVHKLVCLY